MSTRFLASVSNVEEAATVLAAGADIIDIKDPFRGALGAVDPLITEAIVKDVAGRVMTSATVGDLPMHVPCLSRALDAVKMTGIDIIKVGVFTQTLPADILQLIERYTASGNRIVLVLFADLKPRLDDFTLLANAGVYGVMLDTSDKTQGSLRTILDDTVLNRFIRQAQHSGLLTGLAGSLALSDIQSLLKISPDYIGFRGALCSDNHRINSIDIQAVHTIRAMIPSHEFVVPEIQNPMFSVN